MHPPATWALWLLGAAPHLCLLVRIHATQDGISVRGVREAGLGVRVVVVGGRVVGGVCGGSGPGGGRPRAGMGSLRRAGVFVRCGRLVSRLLTGRGARGRPHLSLLTLDVRQDLFEGRPVLLLGVRGVRGGLCTVVAGGGGGTGGGGIAVGARAHPAYHRALIRAARCTQTLPHALRHYLDLLDGPGESSSLEELLEFLDITIQARRSTSLADD